MPWLTVQEGLPHTWERPARKALTDAGVEVRVEDGRLEVEDAPLVRWALERMAELLEANDLIRGLAAEQGRPATPYKPLEPYVLVAALLRTRDGDDAAGWTRLCHEVIWAQALPNANHRATVFWLQSRVTPPGSRIHDPDAIEAEIDAYLHDSKALIHEREHRPDQESLKARHLERTERFVRFWLDHVERPAA